MLPIYTIPTYFLLCYHDGMNRETTKLHTYNKAMTKKNPRLLFIYYLWIKKRKKRKKSFIERPPLKSCKAVSINLMPCRIDGRDVEAEMSI